jgi:hypothetical protein
LYYVLEFGGVYLVGAGADLVDALLVDNEDVLPLKVEDGGGPQGVLELSLGQGQLVELGEGALVVLVEVEVLGVHHSDQFSLSAGRVHGVDQVILAEGDIHLYECVIEEHLVYFLLPLCSDSSDVQEVEGELVLKATQHTLLGVEHGSVLQFEALPVGHEEAIEGAKHLQVAIAVQGHHLVGHGLVAICILGGVLQLVQAQHFVLREELTHNRLRLSIVDKHDVVSEEEYALIDYCDVLVEVDHFVGLKQRRCPSREGQLLVVVCL